MFLHVSVCPRGRRGGQYLGRYPPLDQVHPQPGTRYIPLDQVHPRPGTSPKPSSPLGPGTPLQDQVHPLNQVLLPPGPGTPCPRPGTPWDQVHPLGPGTPTRTRHTPQTRYPPGPDTAPRAVHAGRYGQQAGDTHPTGMHSCSSLQSTS